VTEEEATVVDAPALAALDHVLQATLALARSEASVVAVALVGSCARGTPGPDSDIDLVVLSSDVEDLRRRQDWFAHFGTVQLVGNRQFGDVTERRLRRDDGVEIEIGLASPLWAAIDPLDSGTARVVREGFTVIVDNDDLLAELEAAVRATDAH
jgi:uncharacterized protein